MAHYHITSASCQIWKLAKHNRHMPELSVLRFDHVLFGYPYSIVKKARILPNIVQVTLRYGVANTACSGWYKGCASFCLLARNKPPPCKCLLFMTESSDTIFLEWTENKSVSSVGEVLYSRRQFHCRLKMCKKICKNILYHNRKPKLCSHDLPTKTD